MAKGEFTELERQQIGERIRALMEAQRIRPIDLVKQTGASSGMGTNWRNGTSVPQNQNLHSLADLFGVSWEYILYGKNVVGSAVGVRRDVAVVSESEVDGGDFVALPVLHSLNEADSEKDVGVLPRKREIFSRRQLLRAGLDPDATDDLFCFDLLDDSMSPEMPIGSTAVIDRGSTTITDGQAYAIDRGGLEQIRKLYRTVDGYRIEAENSHRYPSEIADKEVVTVIGRVALWIAM